MSLYRSVRKTVEKEQKISAKARRICALLESATVHVDISGLDLYSMQPKDGEEEIVPPFTSSWIEETVTPPDRDTYTKGMLVLAMDLNKTVDLVERFKRYQTDLRLSDPQFDQNTATVKRLYDKEQIRVVSTAVLSSKNIFGALYVLPFFKSTSESISISGYASVVLFDRSGHTLGSFFDTDFLPEIPPKYQQYRHEILISSLSAAASAKTTYSLLNCRNIVLTNKEPDSGEKSSRKGRVGITWKVLAIALNSSRRNKASAPRSSPEPLTRAHLVRGHFKTFTPDKPLLGRATGRFWWSPQVRGNAERGAVIKDYSLHDS